MLCRKDILVFRLNTSELINSAAFVIASVFGGIRNECVTSIRAAIVSGFSRLFL